MDERQKVQYTGEGEQERPRFVFRHFLPMMPSEGWGASTLGSSGAGRPVIPRRPCRAVRWASLVVSTARAAGTIGYEMLTSLGKRYHRSYLGGDA